MPARPLSGGTGPCAGFRELLFSGLFMAWFAPSAWADPPTPDTAVGDFVTNPATGVDAEVLAVIQDFFGANTYVLTADGDVILVKYQVGDQIACTETRTETVGDPGEEVEVDVCDVYEVVSVETNPDTGFVEVVNLQLVVPEPDPENPEPVEPKAVVQNEQAALDEAAAENEGADGDPELLPPLATAGVINEVGVGASGKSGGNAYGVRICIPLIGCFTIGKSGSSGQPGATGPTIDRVVEASHGEIDSVEDGVSGIKLGSIGGNGGRGGNSFGINLGPYNGGDGGSGGPVTLGTVVDITTSGDGAHGIFAFSRSGRGGDGGDSFIGSAGGSGGSARTGGPVNITNSGDINTFGEVSHGIYALSIGGAAGAGGDSWGIVGAGGSGANGGSGGEVRITNHGTVHTRGLHSHGLFGQSIGGTGGNGGDAGGIAALGGGASAGGTGGNVTITTSGTSRVITEGDYAVGVFAQSVGGSGGDSGGAGGLVSLGSSGGAGSNAGDVTIEAESGGRVTTSGIAAYGLFAQSVGGGGGNAGATGGAVTLGASGSAGGSGGVVTVNSGTRIETGGSLAHGIFAQSVGGGGGASGAAGGLVTIGGSAAGGGTGGTVQVSNSGVIQTTGLDARGIFAQSVGGGGGTGGGTGGLVSLGGAGGAGSSGGEVIVNNAATGAITTTQTGADAIFAQSIGGGGGSGASSGGLVALGGGGSGGGAGHDVTVSNAGALTTGGELARGIFAQSVGGGGGSGGSSGALVGIGGSGGGLSNAGDIVVNNTGAISTAGEQSTALFAQSIGGGGGDGGSSNSLIAVGGKGAGGGDSGSVTVTHGGQIITLGDDALGIFAEAVGGGGGSGGSAFSAGGIAGSAVGGEGALGGDGGAVTVTLSGPSTISTGGERAFGILAQSVGGGGGKGGAAIQGSGSTFGSISTVIGGKGGGGGIGGTASLTGSGTVSTTGGNATGVLLQSVGGGGGAGGLTVAGAAQIGIGGAAVAVTVGASGGDGGAGGTVTSDFDGTINTAGDLSTGFIAQSVGGGGGSGGATVAAAASGGLFASGAMSTAIGGSGGDGGLGGEVNVTLGSGGLAGVSTLGQQSRGILVQSVGGGGGSGGLTIGAAASGAGGASESISTTLGGSGGDGGDGGSVVADISANVSTAGDGAGAVIVQSVGGGGGTGGVAVGAAASGAGGGSLAISSAVGGSGGLGGAGGSVDATIGRNGAGLVATGGDQATGILVQSVGGGGGSGGVSVAAGLSIAGGIAGAITSAVGGSGSGAGDAGEVTADIASDVLTDGDGSSGVIVQSVGGGGGSGGLSVGAAASVAGGGALSVSAAVGGSAALGGDGDLVAAQFTGAIETRQGNSAGLLAQSIGGGGGSGGGAIAATLAGAGVGAGSISAGIGGEGGGGGDGGRAGVDLAVTLDASGSVLTHGDNSAGIVAQSIGGGGGNGGSSIAASGTVSGVGAGAVSVAIGGSGALGGSGKGVRATSGADIVTLGNDSRGLLVQSIGGGGGDGGYTIAGALSISGVGSGTLAVGVGGSGAGGGSAGAVDATSTGSINTGGERSTGFLAQSIGGGGGSGGGSITGSASGGGVGSGAVSGGIGGSAGAGGDGGTVVANSSGNVSTLGGSAAGIVAQSIGGGGGNGGFNIDAALSIAGVGGGVASIGIGGTGGAGGDGDTVTLGVANDVATAGANASAVIAQSVGGGGGNGGFNISAGASGAGVGGGALGLGVGGAGGDGGSGGEVNATVDGSISTAADNSMGVLVQSVGGGGGNGGMSITAAVSIAGVGGGAGGLGVGGFGGGGGESGNVTAATSGSVTTLGDQASGVVAQSIGGGGGNGGISITGTLSGAGVGSGAGSLGIGGFAGGGGGSGVVDSTVDAVVRTSGAQSIGVMAQSIGGGGGNGGMSITATVSLAGVGSGAGGIGIGGFGGDGGDADEVTSRVDGVVVTSGSEASAIVAQSIGGGGGNGGLSVTGTLSGAGTGSGAGSLAIGGAGGGGGRSASVTSIVNAAVETAGDNALGVLAQSVGGGGGSGGIAISATVSLAGTGSGAASLGIGGQGGGGGDAASVDSQLRGSVTTWGGNAAAVTVQSIGGGGGNGGLSVAGTLSAAGTGSGAASLGIGGAGGDGGRGEQVDSVVDAIIGTQGDASVGVLVQSVGGGGGSGGIAIAGTVSAAGTGSGAASLGFGGTGGGGGSSGVVTNAVSGEVVTLGRDAGGIVVQSIGGGGGSGGLSVAGTLSAANTGSGAASVAVGGAGGDGGDAADVSSTVAAEVSTAGENAIGVLAQSVGGGGGNGGIAIAAALSLSGSGGGAGTLGIGGSGGGGGDAGAVTSAVEGMVVTQGADAAGVVAQSVGGGGGSGRLAVSAAVSVAKSGSGALAVGVGGAGGDGGDAGIVDSSMAGYVQTAGEDAIGVLVQSVGGGGGRGGTSIAGTLSGAKSGSGAAAIAIGGTGGGGGDGADVSSSVTGGVITTGERASAVLAQSVGGGGGGGGVSVAGAVNISKESGGSLAIGVGGFGGEGGNAGAVTSTVATTAGFSQVGTTGNDAPAIIAQSIGGGGGSGGVNVTASVNLVGQSGAAIGIGVGGFGGGGGNAGDATLEVTGQVVTEGNNSHGLVAQSLGGGGGNGGVNVTGSLSFAKEGTGGAASIGVGGFGGDGGDAGDVRLSYQGMLQARPRVILGEGSHGILAQSLGGGGGNGGVNVSAGLSFASTKNDGDGGALVIGVGGFGGGGGNAGLVEVTVGEGSSITSFGADRSAIFAQSVGGGGGNGAVNVSAGIVSDAPIVFGLGGFGGDGGTASTVTVNASGDLVASGRNARGIFAQSIGGGGGNGGLNVSGAIAFASETTPPSITVGIGGRGGAGNISDDVTVTQQGSITTSGGEAHGIFAQSIAGGGGNGGANISTALIFADNNDSGGYKDISLVAGIGGHGGAGADAGDTVVVSSGNITTAGDYARGILAQSIGGGGGNGGFNFAGNLAKKSSIITLGIGGFGSGGGDAGEVTVTRGSAEQAGGRITTDGTGAIGIEANSIGGGGGNAGVNIVASVLLGGSPAPEPGGSDPEDPDKKRPHPKHTGVDEEVFTNYDKVLDELEGRNKPDVEDAKDKQEGQSAFAIQLAIGGAGGVAGQGAAATVNNHGDIETFGAVSHGILAQSIGGGGGNAAHNVDLTYIKQDSRNTGLNVSLGGATGDGGSGAAVSVLHTGAIETHGDDSHGIIAQSVGGGGGNAVTNFSKDKADVGKLGISIGRRGGTGGEGGEVTLESWGSVITHGDRSWGLLAQSIGNGGGNSASTTISLELPDEDDTPSRGGSISVGLEGGEGGAAGAVTVRAGGLVQTVGSHAHAIFAQSVGGGGGNGGDASASSKNVSIAVGGTGGTGGTGGAIEISSEATVLTAGEGAIGIIGQSIGGGGGTAGKSDAKVKGKEIALALSLGGVGGVGAAADQVEVSNAGVIITSGGNAHGILAQSLGGGGGNGSMSVASLETEKAKKGSSEQPTPAQLGVAVGGDGGIGASGGLVTVSNSGSIGTEGDGAVGIFAQSIGGGGGNASQVVSRFSGAGAKLNIGIGGTGGTGGTGGDVRVENLADGDGEAGQVITLGDGAHGIVAMSIGGGGGTGSTVVSEVGKGGLQGALSGAPPATGFSFRMGGEGGEGGTSGLVTVINDGSITTQGEAAHGIVAMSIGGGGGIGGASFSQQTLAGALTPAVERAMSLGGTGGSGNVSGDVEVRNTGSIEVFGNRSYGIFAQSVGGGGGSGGLVGVAPEGLAEDDDLPETGGSLSASVSLLDFALGGAGGEGADSGNVLVEHSGTIIAHGNNAFGIYAQAVGGGGGAMGVTYASPVGAALEFVLPLIIGSRDGGTGEAGTVTVNTVGSIVMLGANSRSQHVQSVNGGGGNLDLLLDLRQGRIDQGQVVSGPEEEQGFFSALLSAVVGLGSTAVNEGLGSAIKSEHAGNLVTLGRSSLASLTQSIGGGGGSGLLQLLTNQDTQMELKVTVGGAESTNSSGGDIELARSGDVATTGDASGGASVQSIGGGGGSLLIDVVETQVNGEPSDEVDGEVSGQGVALAQPVAAAATNTDAGTGAGLASVELAMGADGSLDNHGGAINLMISGDTATEGALAPGLLVQSIGGGGGDVRASGLDGLEVLFGGASGASGDGGDIVLQHVGDITTLGELSHAMVVQSIGGGGGLVLAGLDPAAVEVLLSGDNEGSGGDITLSQSGDLVALGDHSIALLVQSLGGGGGALDRVFIGSAGGTGSAGNVTVELDGSLVAGGADGVGILAQSAGSEGQGDISLLLNAGHVIYGGAGGVAVWLSGGAGNRLDNHGAVLTADDTAGIAVLADGGTTSIDNHGTLVGQVLLAPGQNSLANRAEAGFAAGAQVDLGSAGSLLSNAGALLPGDMGQALTVDLNGSFQQSGGGITYAEIDFATDAVDQVLATGAVDLAGSVEVSLLNARFIPVGEFSRVLFQGSQGLTDSGIALLTAPSVVISYGLATTADAALLEYAIDFSPEGLGRNLAAVGEYINRGQLAGGGSEEYGDIITLLVGDPDLTSYRQSLSQLSPDFYAAHQVQFIHGGVDFGQRLMSCRQPGGEYRFTRDGSCIWLQYDSYDWDTDAYDDFKAVKDSTTRVSLGGQKALEDGWAIGFGVSRENHSGSGYDGLWSSRGQSLRLGLSAKRQLGPSKWSAVLSYGSGDTDARRSGVLVDEFRSRVTRDLTTVSGLLRFSHDFEREAWYLRPMIDGGVTRLRARRAEEQGAGAGSLVLEGFNDTYSWVRPALELGREFETPEGGSVRLSLELGVQKFLGGSSTRVRAGIAGAPDGIDPIVVGLDLGDPVYQGRLALEYITRERYGVQVHLGGSRYDRSGIDSAGIRFQLPLP